MSQNMFGQPEQAPEPTHQITEELPGSSRKLLVLAGAGLGAVALAGAAAVFLTGGGDDLPASASLAAAAPSAAAPSAAAPSATAPTTEAPEQLSTLAEFNGRNPFEAKLVEGGSSAAAGASGAAAAAGPAVPGTPVTAPAQSFVTVTFRGAETATEAPDDVLFDVTTAQGTSHVTVVPGDRLGEANTPGVSLEFKGLGDDDTAQVQVGDTKPYRLRLDSPTTLL